MSGDITTRKKKKASGRKKDDDILHEPRNPPIMKIKNHEKMAEEQEVVHEERSLFIKLGYSVIIFVLLASRCFKDDFIDNF